MHKPAEKTKRFDWGNILLISFAHLIHDVFSSFFVPLLPFLNDKLNLNNVLIGSLKILQRIPSLFSPFIGLLADRFPLRIFIILSPLITSITMSLLGEANNIVSLAILLFMAGFSAAIFHVPSPVMIKQLSGNSPGKGMSFYMLGGEFARSLGPVLVTGAVLYLTLDGFYKLMVIGIAFSFILFLRIGKLGHVKPDTANEIIPGVRKLFLELLPFFLIISGFIFFRSIARSSLSTFLTVFLDNEGNDIWTTNGALAIFQLSGALGVLLSGSISDKIGRIKTLYLIAFIVPVLMMVFNYGPKSLMFPTLFLLGFFVIAATPVLLSIVNHVSNERPTFVNGVFMTITFAVGALGDLLTGIMGDLWSLETSFKVAAFLSLGALPFVRLLQNYNSKD